MKELKFALLAAASLIIGSSVFACFTQSNESLISLTPTVPAGAERNGRDVS